VTRCLVHPLFLFTAVWACAAGLYLAGRHTGLFPSAGPLALALVLLNVGTFALGYLTWSTYTRLYAAGAEGLARSGTPLTAARLRRCLQVTLASGAIALLLLAARLVVIAVTYKVGVVRLLSDPVLWRKMVVLYLGQTVGETRLMTVAVSVSSSLFSIGFVLLGVLLYFGRDRRRYVYVLLFFLLLIGIAVVNMSRKEVTVNILFLTLSYLFLHQAYRRRTTAEVLRTLFVPLAGVLLLFVLIDVLLSKSHDFGHQSWLRGFLFSLYWYIAAPLAAFAEFLADHDGTYALGRSMFLPLYKWLYRLHLAGGAGLDLYPQKLHIPYAANVYSYLRNVYEDFGVFGVAVVPYVLGWATSAAERGAHVLFGCLNLYLILLALIIFSFYNYLFSSNQYYLQAFFALVFFRYSMTDLDDMRL
jgi:oligosaccharide repeat unit polymerase